MAAVVYKIKIPYLRRESGPSFPGLVVELQDPSNPGNAVEVRAELDSGAEFSLFQGGLARAVGLDLLGGNPFTFKLANESRIEARILRVVLVAPELEKFEMDLRFSLSEIRRNLLGRDFFDRVQIGFRERHLTVYLTPAP